MTLQILDDAILDFGVVFRFVVHYGEMVKQKMGGREEHAGRDVIVVHRLLKNTVGEKVGGCAMRSTATHGPCGVRTRRAQRNYRYHWRRYCYCRKQ
jgi:hypothetical protein